MSQSEGQGESESDMIYQSFLTKYNEVRAFYDGDKMEECVATAEDLLEETSLPRYFRMKLLLLVAACVDSWYDAQDLLRQAEILWGMVRRGNPQGEDPAVDEAMREVREALDSLKQQQIERQPLREHSDFDPEIDDIFMYEEEEEEEEADVEGDPANLKEADDKALVYMDKIDGQHSNAAQGEIPVSGAVCLPFRAPLP